MQATQERAHGTLDLGSRGAAVGEAPATPQAARSEYLQAAPDYLGAALERLFSELASLPTNPTPAQVRATSLRHRVLELRLLMDFCAFGYEPESLKIFRDLVDEAYQRIGNYQDVCVAEKLLGEPLRPELVKQRLMQMNIALAPLRSHDVQDDVECFVTGSCEAFQVLVRKQVPHLWKQACASPRTELDAEGNLAHLAGQMLRTLRDTGVPTANIMDPDQQESVHDYRKAVRAALTLIDLFPTTRQDIGDLKDPLLALVHWYGEVHDCVIALEAARQIERQQSERLEALVSRFQAVQREHQTILDRGHFDALIRRLEVIEREHRCGSEASATLPAV
jgi:hypothetical protein